MHLGDLADRTVADHFDEHSDRLARVALVTHLGDELPFAGLANEGARLGDGVGEGLFAKHVFAAAQRGHRGDRVGVVGRRDEHRVDLVGHFIEHAPKIAIPLRLRQLLERGRRATVVDVAERDDVLGEHVL